MIKTGIDLVLNSRFEKNLDDSAFLEKVFHASELKDRNKLIGIFALKEAAMKALGKKVDWKEIEVRYDNNGKPEIKLSGEVRPDGFVGIDGSLSHDGEYTVATVIIEVER